MHKEIFASETDKVCGQHLVCRKLENSVVQILMNYINIIENDLLIQRVLASVTGRVRGQHLFVAKAKIQ